MCFCQIGGVVPPTTYYVQPCDYDDRIIPEGLWYVITSYHLRMYRIHVPLLNTLTFSVMWPRSQGGLFYDVPERRKTEPK